MLTSLIDQDDLNESALQFNFADLLDSKSRMPEIYNMALHEIQLLEEKPLCHRLAAQLTMDSCRDPEDGGEKTYQWGYAHVQSHKIQCFTLALTMCDLESGQIAIPDTCTPFSSSVLSQISRDEKSKFEVSTQNKDACLKSLAPPNPPQYWDTFLNNRQMAMLFCQAARIDMEKGTWYSPESRWHFNELQMSISLCTRRWRES
jgi:hypothetical protein